MYLVRRAADRFYDLALISYVLALGHFALEAVVYRTAGLGPGLISPLIVASEFITLCLYFCRGTNGIGEG